MTKNTAASKNRWIEILVDYRKDYKKKYLSERKAKKIEQQVGLAKDKHSKAELKKELNAILSEVKQQDEYLMQKYRLKKLLDPFKVSDEDFQDSPFIVVEVVSLEDDWLTVRIDRSFSATLIKDKVSTIMKDLDEVEGRKPKKSGRPRRISEPATVSKTAKSWREHYTRLQKIFERSPRPVGAVDDFITKIRNTTVSELVMDELREIYPHLKENTLREYAKPYQNR